MTTAQRRYPLGTDQGELERLHLQHQLWSDAAHALWRRAAIAPGARVLDVGAGPGAASLDLAQLVTASGRVLALDESPAFVDFLSAEAAARALPQLTPRVADVQALDALSKAEAGSFQAGSFDAAYARWVFCFLPRPEAAIRGIARLLRTGGVLCVHDYFNYTSMTPAPRRKSYDEVVAATARSWIQNGGDPDVVGRLPALLHDAGLTLEHLEVHQRVARPGDQMWHWTLTWWRSYTPKLVAMGLLNEAQERAFHDDVAKMTRERDFIVLPPVYEVMARKR
jgi:SAM-dependent methyltransferase